MSEYLPHLNAIGTAKFLLCMVSIVVLDCWYRMRHEGI